MHVDNIFEAGKITFLQPLNNPMSFNALFKVAPTEGNLVYEYNPFRNYRLTKDMFEYGGHYYTREELANMGITTGGNSWSGIPADQDVPLLMQAGCLVDFETEQLSFDVNHPVDVLPQYSYDGSVNLILNDGKNIPRLINSRFTSIGMNKYKVIDRKDDNDTNIYDQGSQFDVDTSLYKRVVEIPELDFLGVSSGGNMSVGNYTFYFKYSDADGNETDFVAESGIVSMFVGTELNGIVGGRQDENTYKLVKFFMRNIDASYSYVYVYYVRNTADIQGEVIKKAYKINKKYEVSKQLNCQITVTGYEEVEELTLEDINIQYCIASSVVAQASCQNRLFLGNIYRPNIDYKELSDLSLRFCPIIHRKEEIYEGISFDYTEEARNTYCDPNFIYKYTGYANGGEMYCFAVVYILSDNTLSPAFYVRGASDVSDGEGQYTRIPIYQDVGGGVRRRIYISSNEETGEIVSSNESGDEATNYEINNLNCQNAWGIISTNVPSAGDRNDSNSIYGIKMYIDPADRQDLMDALSAVGIKGFFFVRQSRIPLTLCQALTIGIDKYSKTPVVPASTTVMKQYYPDLDTGETGVVDDEICYITERFLSNDRKITNDFVDRLYMLSNNNVANKGAICPDYDCNIGYFNNIFNGSNFYVNEANFKPMTKFLTMDGVDPRHLYTDVVTNDEFDNGTAQSIAVVTVNDGAPAVATANYTWRAMAGTAEESYRFEYLERENKVDSADNLVRGLWGNYLGIDGYEGECKIINIKSPEAVDASIYDRMQVRHADKTPYRAISKRYSIKAFYKEDGSIKDSNGFDNELGILYRGDSFICTFTHRFNRNFQDPESPINDKIVDEDTWINNYTASSNENYDRINRGDLNAVQMGIWITFPVVSYKNLNVRSLDNSYPGEEALTGHKRGFYPYYADSPEGSYKIPESMFINQGLSVNLSERWNIPVPDVPYIKNEFQTRILYSDVHVNDAFKNGFRVFQATHFKDYPRTYGCIIKLVELSGGLLCVYEHGVVYIPVNERVEAGNGSGGSVFINTQNVLPDNPRVISDTFGSQWKESVIKTPYGIYGVDTVGKKIWRTDGTTFEIISDFCIQEFLNLNISLTERELLPIIGVRNVKSHYNRFKQDVMFTFYDNTVGFEEKVWSICYNELLKFWVTFYSWIPSYSANIDNIYFSFDRDTSKWISKLGISNKGNSFSHGIVLTNNIIKGGGVIGQLDIVGVEFPAVGTDISYSKEFTLERDNFGYYKMFNINGNTLSFNGDYNSLLANIFVIDKNTGRRVFLNRDNPNFKDTIVYELNIRCKITLNYDGDDNNIKWHVNGWNENQQLGMGYYDCSVAVIPQDNIKYLTTDFWKHGQAGIIDIADKLKPTVWYGKLHPFEFEFVVVDDSAMHKIFDNLEIIGNMAEPESFHYEVVGDAYSFMDDKVSMYFRQEALRALYQYNGSNILYDHDFWNREAKQRKRVDEVTGEEYIDKTTMFPFYYMRTDTFNNVEDYYKAVTAPNKDYNYLSGTEVTYNKTMDEYHLWVHSKAVDIKSQSRLRGNMWYLEDKWYVEIAPINFVQKNEIEWRKGSVDCINDQGLPDKMPVIPIPVSNSPCPNDLINTNISNDDFPKELKMLGYNTGDIDTSDWGNDYVNDARMRYETKVRDKWCRIRIRYSGKKLVIVQAVRTMFTQSFI